MANLIRPFVEINGVDSRTIDGLMITKLPPITKAPVRTEITTVDGRDGDIVEVLGYEAYDRPLEIGLYGNYSVDEIIKYFNTSGKIILSNEPDKEYDFAVYEQIDLESLLRFKTATVMLHTQPYKYSAIESDLRRGSALNTVTQRTYNIVNKGNVDSQPSLRIYSRGPVKILINDVEVFSYYVSGSAFKYILIDPVALKTYISTTGVLFNRYTEGDFNDIKLSPGENKLVINGEQRISYVYNYSRWV